MESDLPSFEKSIGYFSKNMHCGNSNEFCEKITHAFLKRLKAYQHFVKTIIISTL